MKKKAAPVLAIVLLIVIVAGIGFLTRVIKKYTPSSEVMSSQEYFGLDHEGEAAIVAGSEILPYKGKILNEVAYVDYQAVKEVLESLRVVVEANEEKFRKDALLERLV